MAKAKLKLDGKDIAMEMFSNLVFENDGEMEVSFSEACQAKIEKSQQYLMELLETGEAIYGVTTGFGRQGNQLIGIHQSERLQSNLVAYLQTGTGDCLDEVTSRVVTLARLLSLAKGFSGVGMPLLNRIRILLENGISPHIPKQGSLGASGDLVPLSYLGAAIQGSGKVWYQGQIHECEDLYPKLKLGKYTLMPKEGLAIVNGTSAMLGQAIVNWRKAKNLFKWSLLQSGWLGSLLNIRPDAFGTLVNETAKNIPGQSLAARALGCALKSQRILGPPPFEKCRTGGKASSNIQAPYSIRCVPQIAGPWFDTCDWIEQVLEKELNSASDNPLLDGKNRIHAMGGNFYGGYISHAMDYLKICIANCADLLDRQLLILMDQKTHGDPQIPDNLVFREGMDEDEHHLHHGLKALHQSVGAITSEIMALATPNSIFSRSSESHNQDKVSLGMSAAVQCESMLQKLLTIQVLYNLCLAQATDIKHMELTYEPLKNLYRQTRLHCDTIRGDQPLSEAISKIQKAFLENSLKGNWMAIS